MRRRAQAGGRAAVVGSAWAQEIGHGWAGQGTEGGGKYLLGEVTMQQAGAAKGTGRGAGRQCRVSTSVGSWNGQAGQGAGASAATCL